MPYTAESAVVDFDTEAALAAVRGVVENEVYSFVEFDADRFNAVYVADETLALYEDEAEMLDHFERIHRYVNLDFQEVDLFVNELLPIADEVRYKTTALDTLKIVRYYYGRQGLFLALDPREPVEPLVDAIEDALDHG